MKQTVNLYKFRRAFETLRPDNFSFHGLEALFDHLEEYEQGIGQESILDVIAICCDYCELKTEAELCAMYSLTMEEIRENTQVIEFDGGIIIQSF